MKLDDPGQQADPLDTELGSAKNATVRELLRKMGQQQEALLEHRFYDRLLSVLGSATVRDGQWQLLECAPAWDGNGTSDCHLAWLWIGKTDDRRLVAVNYAGHQSQYYVRLPAQGKASCGSRI